MDDEVESRLIELQVCIDEGHSYEIDNETYNGEIVDLLCASCGYVKTVSLTKEQTKAFDERINKEEKLLKELLGEKL